MLFLDRIKTLNHRNVRKIYKLGLNGAEWVESSGWGSVEMGGIIEVREGS